MDSKAMLEALDSRLREIFAAYARGHDVPPAQRYRAEGFAEALIEAGELSEQGFAERVAGLYREETGEALPAFKREECRVPFLMQRAPVYPSTQ